MKESSERMDCVHLQCKDGGVIKCPNRKLPVEIPAGVDIKIDGQEMTVKVQRNTHSGFSP